MRVLENPTELAPIGGVEQSMLQVAEQLVARGHSLSGLYVTGGSNLPAWEALTDELRQVPSFDCTQAHFARDLARLPAAVRAARALSPDVVYLNRAEQMVFGLLASRFSRAPLVVHLRTHLHFPGVKVAGRMAAHFIAVSDFVRDHWIAAGVPASKITTVHNGIDPRAYPAGGVAEREQARTALGIPADVYTVLYYGRVSDGKGVGTLIEAWRRLGLGPDEARLVIVGGSPPDRADDFERDLRDRQPAGCHWLPMTADVMPALHASDTVVLPAEWQEPFGRVVIEGMSSGRPVIGTRVGGIPEILTGEFAGLLVDPGDPVGLAERIRGLRDWRVTDPELGRRCTAHVQDHFSLERTVDGVERVLLAATGQVVTPTRSETLKAAL